MTKQNNLYHQLQEGTSYAAAILLGVDNPGPVWNCLLRDIPANPAFNKSFTVGDVVRYILAFQTEKFKEM